MATRNASAPYDVTLRRGRITLLAIIILIAVSEMAIVALTLGFRGWQTGWRTGFGAVLTFVLLRALYKGYEAARWLTIVLLVMVFVLFADYRVQSNRAHALGALRLRLAGWNVRWIGRPFSPVTPD